MKIKDSEQKKEKQLINIRMAAERYHVLPKTISQWVYLGKIPFIRIKGHRTMFDLEELERWEAEGSHGEKH